MDHAEAAAARIDELAAELEDGEVERKALFGHPALYTAGKAFVWAAKDDARVQLKLPDAVGAELIAAGRAEVGFMGPRPVQGWYTIVDEFRLDEVVPLALAARDHVRALQRGA